MTELIRRPTTDTARAAVRPSRMPRVPVLATFPTRQEYVMFDRKLNDVRRQERKQRLCDRLPELSDKTRARHSHVMWWSPELLGLAGALVLTCLFTWWFLVATLYPIARVVVGEARRRRSNARITAADAARLAELHAERDADRVRFDVLRAVRTGAPVRATAVRTDQKDAA